MEKLFRIQIAKFFRRTSEALPKFHHRSIDVDVAREYSQRPIVLLTNSQNTTEYFFAVTPFGTSPGKVLIELGWKSESRRAFPAVNVDRVLEARKLETGEFDWTQDAFAARLAPLCNRGSGEMVWDMFSPEVWDETSESFKEFSRRTAFGGSDEALRIISSGGFDEQYAASQVDLVCGDILKCMKEFGIPFLQRAAARRGEELFTGL